NMAVKLPENNRHWTTNWEFRVSDKTPSTKVYAGHGEFSGTTTSFPSDILDSPEFVQHRYDAGRPESEQLWRRWSAYNIRWLPEPGAKDCKKRGQYQGVPVRFPPRAPLGSTSNKQTI